MIARPLFRGAVLAVALSFPLTAFATTITIVNKDLAGVGFNDPTPRSPVNGNSGTTLGEQRLNVFTYAASFWAQQVESPVEIRVEAYFEAKDCSSTSAVLGGARASFVVRDFEGVPREGTWYPSALANKLAGEDLYPDAADTDVEASFTTALDDGSCGFPKKWYYGLDAKPPTGTTDFATVVIHELGHGLGFSSYVSRTTGAKLSGDDGVGYDDDYMVHLYDATSGKTWNQMTDDERLASMTNTTNLLWNGPSVVAVAPSRLQTGLGTGGRPQIYAPNPSEPGSSVSHWSTSVYPNEIMEPFVTTAMHSLLITGELMKDLGWSLASGSSRNSWILPSSAKTPGQGGAYYSTALSIANRGAAEARFTMKFLGHDTDGTSGPVSSERVLGPNQSVTYEDVLGSIFSQPDRSYGAIQLNANVPTLSVLGQTATPVLTDWASCVATGSFGQSVPAFAQADLISTGSSKVIVGIREDSSFRTNLILANAGTAEVEVTAILFAPSGATLGSSTWTLPPLGMTQKTQFARQMGVTSDVRDANVLLSTTTAGGSFAAYAAVIDKVTNDPRTLLPK